MAHITVYSQLIFTKIVLDNQYKHLKNWGGGGGGGGALAPLLTTDIVCAPLQHVSGACTSCIQHALSDDQHYIVAV